MADYTEIKGNRIQYLDSDPTLTSATEGQVWYNTATGTLKGLTQIKAFSSGANYPQGTYGVIGGAGTQTAGLAFGGRNPGPSADHDKTNEYSGYAWSAGSDMGTSRYGIVGCGTQTAALGAGGYQYPGPGVQSAVEEYDGSSWTSGGALPAGNNNASITGIQTAALFAGGSPGGITTAITYNGTAWTSAPSMNTGRYGLRSTGTTTDAIVFGGGTPGGVLANTESFNGSAWSEVSDMNTARRDHLAIGGTSSSHAVAQSGYTTTNVNTTEEWDGSIWTTAPSSTASHRGGSGFGSASAGVSAAGGSSPYTATEEYNSTIDTFTAAAWSSGGNLPSTKRSMASSKGGDINSSLFFGGDNLPMGAGQPQINTTEEYNGTSWSGGGNVGNNVSGSTGAGTQTAMIGATGYSFPTPWTTAGASYIANAFEYDGSSWSNVTAVPTTGVGLNSFGTQTASVFGGGAQGGSPGPEASNRSTTYHEYDGTSWTSGGSSNNVHGRTQAAAGILTAGVVFGGTSGPGARGDTLESYNGTTWTEESSGLIAATGMGGFGTQTSFVFAGGSASPIPASPGTVGYNVGTYNWNGTAISSSANTATNHMYTAGDGTSGAATGFIAGGSSAYASNTTSTEEYTEATTPVATASTLSSS
jgi:hypothetical protein